ncbi:MAG: L-threonylcarbamoyladenylate synthase [Pseudomonadota bacterium]
MTQRFSIHPRNPQQRLIDQAAQLLRDGELIVVPTDTTYALCCHLGDKRALEQLRQLRRLPDNHRLTLMVRDLAELATYARVDNTDFRVLKHYTPGPFTFVLLASREVPRRLLHPKRKTVGLRVPDSAICQALLAAHGEPVLTTTLKLPGADDPLTDPQDAYDALAGRVALIIDGGAGGFEPTTVVDLEGDGGVIRQGAGQYG